MNTNQKKKLLNLLDSFGEELENFIGETLREEGDTAFAAGKAEGDQEGYERGYADGAQDAGAK